MYETINTGLIDFLKKSPTAFHSTAQTAQILRENGYQELRENRKWQIVPGGKYYVIRNGSSIIALNLGTELEQYSFRIAASHSDSPAFKIKEKAELSVRGKYMQLNTEGYGGMLCAPWFDRPLSVAGRVVVKEGESLVTKLLDIPRDLVMIPNVAIHMNRSVNEGTSYNKQIDMLPLFGGSDCKAGDFYCMIADELGTVPENMYGTELFLYNRTEPSVWGANREFLSAPRLDDLQCAYASLQGFLDSKNIRAIGVYVCLDNEEVGSGTKQGAKSTFLKEVMSRVNSCLGKTQEDYERAVAGGFMLSCDNAHAVHPNHPEKTDVENCVYMNEGVVVKSHAGQKYTSDAVSIAVFKELCERAEVPVQFFANRSDAAGGSTLGNLAMEHVSMNCVDIGLPQLAMHSPYETAGVKDTAYLAKAVRTFYDIHMVIEEDRIIF